MRNPRRLVIALAAGAGVAFCVLATASAQPQSKHGGSVAVGMIGPDADTLDPTVSQTSLAVQIYVAMCKRLYERDEQQNLVPMLASGQPVYSKDRLSYAINLRRDVKFNDGTPFDAQAVVTSVERLMNHPRSSRKSDFDSVQSVSTAGPHTVVFHLKFRDAAFQGNPWVLSPNQLDKVGEGFGAEPVCAGPFMFKERVPADHITVVRSPYWYDRKNVFLDRIVYRPMSSQAVAVAALKAGDIQAVDSVTAADLPAIQRSSRLRVLQKPQLGWFGVIVNIGNTRGVVGRPYENVGTALASSALLRQAFEEAIDRDTLNRVVYGGLVQPSCTEIPPSNAPWFDATRIPCNAYNPAHAKRLVSASGVTDPTVRLLTAALTDRLLLAQFIKTQEEAVGIHVLIETTSENPASVAGSGKFDAVLLGWIPGGPDPHGQMFQFLATNGARNYSGYSNARMDFVLGNGQKATKLQARSTYYRVAQQIAATDRPIIPLFNPITVSAFSARLEGVRLTPAGALYLGDARYT